MLPPRCHIAVGLLGGSFNPAHEGHRYISVEALKRLGLDEIWWLVSPQNPLKPQGGMKPLAARLALAKAVANHPRICVTHMETQLNTVYTIDTLLKLKKKYPSIRFVWLMGADNLVQFTRWKRWRAIVRLLPIVVFDRGNNSLSVLHSKAALALRPWRVTRFNPGVKPPAWVFLALKKHPASATAIRNAGKA